MARMIDGLTPDAIADLAELAMKLSKNEKTRKGFLKSVKVVDPDRAMPVHEVETLREEIEEREAARKIEEEKRDLIRRLEAQRAALGLSDDELKEVEKVMETYGMTDYEAARDLWQARKPPAPPADGPTATWTFPTIPNLLEDPAGAARNEAFNVITEIRRKQRAA